MKNIFKYISEYRFNVIDLWMVALLGVLSTKFSQPEYLIAAVVILIVVSGVSVHMNIKFGKKQ